MLKRSLLLMLLIATTATAGYAEDAWKGHQPSLITQHSGTTQLLISVSPVNSRVVWAAGAGGTYVVTTNGGSTWRSGVVPGAEKLQFRDVQGVSDRVAYLMSIGDNTGDFRIYKTEDGGRHWTIQFKNRTVNAFYDCFAFWTPDRGITHSDSVNGAFPDIRTFNGTTWHSIKRNMPPALAGEASFSSSGTCITTLGWQDAWIATGGSTTARILATRDGGDSWDAYDTPLVSNPAAGGFSVAFRIPGMASSVAATWPRTFRQAATSDNGGQTWALTKSLQCRDHFLSHICPRSWAWRCWTRRPGRKPCCCDYGRVGPELDSGSAAWSPDEGHTWFQLPGVSGYWAVAFATPKAGWFVGNGGQILKISF